MPRPDRVTLLAFAGVVVLAGGNAVAIAFSNAELPPFWGASLRFALAAAVFVGIAAAARRPFPRGRAMRGALLFGVLGFFLAYACAYWGILHIPPGLAQVLLGLTPLLTLLLATALRQERFRWVGLAGALVSLGGIVVIFREGLGTSVSLAGAAAIVAGAVAIALSNIALKGYPKGDVVTTNAVAMGSGAVLLLALSFATGERMALPRLPATWAALVFVVVVGSVAVFWLFVFTLQRWTASAVSYLFVLLPLVTLPLSAWLTGERLTPALLGGAALVLAGVYLGAVWRPSAQGA